MLCLDSVICCSCEWKSGCRLCLDLLIWTDFEALICNWVWSLRTPEVRRSSWKAMSMFWIYFFLPMMQCYFLDKFYLLFIIHARSLAEILLERFLTTKTQQWRFWRGQLSGGWSIELSLNSAWVSFVFMVVLEELQRC